MFQTNLLNNFGGEGILVIDTCPKWHFEIWPFLWFLGSQLVNLGPIDFSFGLHLDISVVHISINMAKKTIHSPK